MARRALLLAALAAGACNHPSGLLPVGGAQSSTVEIERFVRRLHLDLAGAPPSAAALQADSAELEAAGNTAEARGALADRLVTTPAFGETFVAELENRVFAGEPVAARYQLICTAVRNLDRTCQACTPPANDACACACANLAFLSTERTLLAGSPADLTAGTPTGQVERRYAAARVFTFSFAEQDQLAGALFTAFLGRPAGPDELRNATALAYDSMPPPKGLLFGRLGTNYADLIDIVFTSDVYREAIVDGAFARYLGRPATPVERSVFSGRLDAGRPDLRPVIRAVVSSREYFGQ